MLIALCPSVVPVPAAGRDPVAPPAGQASFLLEARRPPRQHPPRLTRQIRPAQALAGYAAHAVTTSLAAAAHGLEQAVAHAGAAALAMGAGVAGAGACVTAPVESVKAALDVGAARRKARSAWGRAALARQRLQADVQADASLPASAARSGHWLEYRHALESWAATRRCFRGDASQIQQRADRWVRERDALKAAGVPSAPARRRRQRLDRRLEALAFLGAQRVSQLRSGAVTTEKRLKEGITVTRAGTGLLTQLAQVGLQAAGQAAALVVGAASAVVLPVLLLAEGLFGSVEATQLIDRALAGQQQLRDRQQRTRLAASTAPLANAPGASPAGLFRLGLGGLHAAFEGQQRALRHERLHAGRKRLRSAAYTVLAPVALGVGVAALVAASFTPAGIAVVALVGGVALAYAISQAVFARQQQVHDRRVRSHQQDHADLCRREPAGARRGALLKTDRLWAGNEYLAVDVLVQALVLAAHRPGADRALLADVLAHRLGFGADWADRVLALAGATPPDAAPADPGFRLLCEALQRQFGLPVPKARRLAAAG